MTRRVRAIAIVGGLLLAGAPHPARAYVRALTEKTLLPVYWATGCQAITVYLNGFTEMTADEVAKSVAGAAHAWSPDVVTCPAASGDGGTGAGHPSFEIVTQMASGGPVPEIGADGRNSLIFRTDSWGLNDPAAIALTSKNTNPSGRIFDADIEVNAVVSVIGTPWANLDPNAPAAKGGMSQLDLQTALTHEFGHFLGLAHTCYRDDYDLPPHLADDQGRPAPECEDGAGIPEAQAVMWFEVAENDTAKRTLTTDDARGVCAIYPPTDTPPACTLNQPDDGCGCATGGTGAGGIGTSLALAALLGTRRRRR